jgi:ArsR family transcriptional regulator
LPTNVEAEVDAVFRALSSRPRREILRLLASGVEGDERCCATDEVCACVFAERLGLSASTVSHHMKTLTQAGLVSARKQGLWMYYRLRPEAFDALLQEFSYMASCCREETS